MAGVSAERSEPQPGVNRKRPGRRSRPGRGRNERGQPTFRLPPWSGPESLNTTEPAAFRITIENVSGLPFLPPPFRRSLTVTAYVKPSALFQRPVPDQLALVPFRTSPLTVLPWNLPVFVRTWISPSKPVPLGAATKPNDVPTVAGLIQPPPRTFVAAESTTSRTESLPTPDSSSVAVTRISRTPIAAKAWLPEQPAGAIFPVPAFEPSPQSIEQDTTSVAPWSPTC